MLVPASTPPKPHSPRRSAADNAVPVSDATPPSSHAAVPQGPAADPATLERDAVLPPTLGQLAWTWGRNVLVVAFAISIAIHVMGVLVARGWTLSGGGGGMGLGAGNPAATPTIEMAIASDEAIPTGPVTPESIPAVPLTIASGEPTDVPIMGDGPSDEPSTGAGAGDPASDLAGGGDVGLGAGDGLGGAGGGGGARFFGVEARGSRFAFIVDVSASMEIEGRIERLRQELRRSVTTLGGGAEYVIIAFSDGARVIGGNATWTRATDTNNRRTLSFVDTLQTQASTNPRPAFEIIFDIRPRPDAIYFMTDGEFDEGVVDEVAIKNRAGPGGLIPVHSIVFGSDVGAPLMKRIAEQSKGTYTFVPSNRR